MPPPPASANGTVLPPALGLPPVIIAPGETGMSGGADAHCALDKLALATRIYEDVTCRSLG
jgi:succinyl-diaminopimelate desuccinylase